MAATYEPIATTTLGSNASTYTFSSIPGTYTDLVLVCNASTTTDNVNYYLQFNSDSATNYSFTYLEGDGSSAASSKSSGISYLYVARGSSNSYFDVIVANIMNYSSTTNYKAVLSRYALGLGLGKRNSIHVGSWSSNSAITSITIGSNGGTLKSGSTFTLYGIKAA